MPPASHPIRTPGRLIQERLEARGWTQRTLSVILNIGEASVTRLLNGKQPIDAEIAVALEDVLGLSAEELLHLQANLDLADARSARPRDSERVTRARLYGELPLREMIKRGWIEADSIRETQKVEASLTRLFGVYRMDEIAAPGAGDRAVCMIRWAWFCRVRQIAAAMPLHAHGPPAAADAIQRLRPCLQSLDLLADVPRILSDAGIRLVIVESLTGANIDGTCLWLDGRSPVIALSLRHDRIDQFWFLLRHALEHVTHGESCITPTLIESAPAQEDLPDTERAANEAAAEYCVPPALLDTFIARKSPFISTRDMIAFAAELRVHPGVVMGQIQRRTGRYEHLSSHFAKVRPFLAHHAACDGWGHVFPLSLR